MQVSGVGTPTTVFTQLLPTHMSLYYAGICGLLPVCYTYSPGIPGPVCCGCMLLSQAHSQTSLTMHCQHVSHQHLSAALKLWQLISCKELQWVRLLSNAHLNHFPRFLFFASLMIAFSRWLCSIMGHNIIFLLLICIILYAVWMVFTSRLVQIFLNPIYILSVPKLFHLCITGFQLEVTVIDLITW